jgi:F-type H+-transporting ATPase subunit b
MRSRPLLAARRLLPACETPRKLGMLLVAACALCAPARAAAQPPRAEPASSADRQSAVAPKEGTNEHSGRGAIEIVARIVNFAILAGTLTYFLRSPLRNYLAGRDTQIRSDLVNAAETKREAAAEIEAIDQKMRALPAELDALRAEGAKEIAAEEGRIKSAAAAERDRLLEQARREIDLQVKVAERDLVAHAADLAVGVASERIRKNITDEDQKRLVDRYVQQLKG